MTTAYENQLINNSFPLLSQSLVVVVVVVVVPPTLRTHLRFSTGSYFDFCWHHQLLLDRLSDTKSKKKT
jgi:hypothetical protein